MTESVGHSSHQLDETPRFRSQRAIIGALLVVGLVIVGIAVAVVVTQRNAETVQDVGSCEPTYLQNQNTADDSFGAFVEAQLSGTPKAPAIGLGANLANLQPSVNATTTTGADCAIK